VSFTLCRSTMLSSLADFPRPITGGDQNWALYELRPKAKLTGQELAGRVGVTDWVISCIGAVRPGTTRDTPTQAPGDLSSHLVLLNKGSTWLLEQNEHDRCGNLTAMTGTTNVLADVPRHLPDELFTTLLESADVRIERIVSHGHASPPGFWYDQEPHEWVMVLQGAARLRFEDEAEPIEMRPGDAIHIEAHKKHRVEWTTPEEPTVWLAVHYRR